MERTSLDDVLSDKPEATQAAEPVAPASPAEKTESAGPQERSEPRVTSKRREFLEKEWDARAAGEGKVRDPVTGQFVAKQEPEDKGESKAEAKTEAKEEPKAEAKQEPAKPEQQKQDDFTPRERAFLKAAEEERRKRQALEQQMTASAAQAKPQEPAKPFNEDPDGALTRYQESTRAEVMRHKLQVADMVGAVRYPDYAAKRDVFLQICEAHPHLRDAALNAADPAAFAYSIAKQALDRHEWEQAGGADGMRAKIEKEVREKLEAEYAEKQKGQKDTVRQEAERLPGSLSHTRSVGGNNRAAWGGPSSLDEILQ